jgi:hypothetical protein
MFEESFLHCLIHGPRPSPAASRGSSAAEVTEISPDRFDCAFAAAVGFGDLAIVKPSVIDHIPDLCML